MKDKVLEVIDIKQVVTNSLVGVILGLLLILVPVSFLTSLIVVLIGLFLLVYSGIGLYKDVSSKNESTNSTLFYALGLLVGFLLLFFPNTVVIILCSIYLIIKPLAYVAIAKFNKEILNVELPKIVLGLVLLMCLLLPVMDAIFKVVGVIILLLSIGYLAVNYLLYKKSGIKIK